MIILFSIKNDWFPTSGMENSAMFYEGLERVKDIAHHLVLPTITLSLFYLALYTRMMRASMLEQYGQDYVITARAKGVTERRITFVHVLRNALLPVVTMIGYPHCLPTLILLRVLLPLLILINKYLYLWRPLKCS